MKTLCLFFSAVLLSTSLVGQCLENFTKLLPVPSTDYGLAFGAAYAMSDDYLFVGVPNSDSLGRLTGLVRIFKRSGTDWKLSGVLTPSVPVDVLQLGGQLKVSGDYLLVSAGVNGGRVYIFKKQPGGWASQTEVTWLSAPNTTGFGFAYFNTFDITADQNTIAVTDPYYAPQVPVPDRTTSGAVFVFHKDAAEEWTNTLQPVIIQDPMVNGFARGGVALFGNRMAVGHPFSSTGNGNIFVYKDTIGNFSKPKLEVRLSSGNPGETLGLGLSSLVFNQDGIFTVAGIDELTSPKPAILYFQKPALGNWTATTPACAIAFGAAAVDFNGSYVSTNGTDLIVSYHENSLGYVKLLSKNSGSWCSPLIQPIEQALPNSTKLGGYNATNQNADIVTGYTGIPGNETALLALKVYTRISPASWQSSFVFSEKKSTAGHRFGNNLLGFGDYLFVSAPDDGTVKSGGGAVYTYHKISKVWQPTGKIIPSFPNANDNVFGTALATNGTYLAVGASGFRNHGSVFVYKKNAADWSSVVLVQEIILPENILTVFAYGDHLAISDEWLVIPYVQNDPGRIMAAFYRFNGTTWIFNQAIELGLANIFAKFTTVDLSIHGNTLLVGGTILQPDNSGQWVPRFQLSPSDPEPIQIAPDFSHFISNGDLFGTSVFVEEDRIFIGAPQKDYNGTWDVGAVYVFTKLPGESWTSRTESGKIYPPIKAERALFGYSVQGIENILTVGAPGADYNLDGSARNKPGHAYVFQSLDYFWKDVTPLADFSGDSFVKDYFGYSVNRDESDFFIAAPIEDIPTGKLSGTVYVTAMPPLVRHIPPVCVTESAIDLYEYPSGGTWSGPGITNASLGVFDPKVAGVGIHTVTYKITSCSVAGKMQVEVLALPAAIFTGNPKIYVCANSNVNIELAIQPQAGSIYQWFYRAQAGAALVPQNVVTPFMIATKRGIYNVKIIRGSACETFSEDVTIEDEIVVVTITPIPPVCNNTPHTIQLQATPAGGIWSGLGVSGDQLSTAGMMTSTNGIGYTYTSPAGCTHQSATNVSIITLEQQTILKNSGDLCKTGKLQLESSGVIGAGTILTWYKKAPQDADFTETTEHRNFLTVTENDFTYKVRASNGSCEIESLPYIVSEKLVLSISPEPAVTICSDAFATFTISGSTEAKYHWFYATDSQKNNSKPLSSSNRQISVTEAGYYYAVVESFGCVGISPMSRLLLAPVDSIFIPNVFTPNNDGINDVFRIYSSGAYVEVSIINRWGNEIYSDNANRGWTGEGYPTGTYFWQATYLKCGNKRYTERGWISLQR